MSGHAVNDYSDESGEESESSQENQDREDFDDWEDEGEDAEIVTCCLFCDYMGKSVADTLGHMVPHHGFDLVQIIKSRKLEFYQGIKLVNYIRSKVKENVEFGKAKFNIDEHLKLMEDESFLQPVLQDDPLLMYVGEIEIGEEETEKEIDQPQMSETEKALRRKVEELEKKIMVLEHSFRNYKALTEATFNQDVIPIEELRNEQLDSSQSQRIKSNLKKDGYFQSYSYNEIHEEMIKDEVRTNSYRDFIEKNPHLFKDKIVLDVGCGTSILSLFAARAGAKHVYGVDASLMAEKAKEIIKVNGYEDRITILYGKMEEIQLPVEKVDVIISEWMGYFLLFESMLDTVLFARDKYLAKDGRVFPKKSLMYLMSADDTDAFQKRENFWENVHGFNFSMMKNGMPEDPVIEHINLKKLASNPCLIQEIDAEKVSVEALNFSSTFSLEAIRDHVCNCLAGYFDIIFDEFEGVYDVKFSTSPSRVMTHWKQTLFYLDHSIPLLKGEKLEGTIQVHKNSSNHRWLDIEISYSKLGDSNSYKKSFVLG